MFFSRTHGIIFYSYICFRRDTNYDRESTVPLLCLAAIMKGKKSIVQNVRFNVVLTSILLFLFSS